MAKTVNCVFCGKEMTSGFFKGDANYISIGYETIDCCDECRAKYEKEVKRIGKRFEIKLENYKKATKKKVDSKTLAEFFLRYLEEEKDQIARCGRINGDVTDGGYYAWNEKNHYFAIREFPLGSDSTASQMGKSLKKLDEYGDVWFSKDDITKLEYRTTTFGESGGLFSTAFSFEIRFNDEKVVTYKPCITKIMFVGTGLFPHSQKKKAKQQCAAFLEILKKSIDSDLTVTEVKKFN